MDKVPETEEPRILSREDPAQITRWLLGAGGLVVLMGVAVWMANTIRF